MTAPISVVVPTRDRPEMLRRCLASLAPTLNPADELIVVDSVSRDPEAIKREAVAAGGTYVRVAEPGATRARNAGWRHAQFDLVGFVDDDTWMAPGWADAVRSTFTALPQVAFLTGRIDAPADQQHILRPVAIKDDDEPHDLDRWFTGIVGHSANMAARRSALERVGGFDDRMGPGNWFGGADDNDLFDRFFGAGLLGRYEPTMRGWHDQWRSPREVVHNDWITGKGMGARLAKLLRADSFRARHAVRVLLWDWGLHDAYVYARHREWILAFSGLTRVTGGLIGLARALPVRVRDGHFVAAR